MGGFDHFRSGVVPGRAVGPKGISTQRQLGNLPVIDYLCPGVY